MLAVRSQLTAASIGFISLSSAPIVFAVGNCTAGTGRAVGNSGLSVYVVDACAVASELACSSCGFGTYTLASNNAPCNVLSSANAVSTGNLVCALPGYWVLVDNSTATTAVYACAPGMCTGAAAHRMAPRRQLLCWGLFCHNDNSNNIQQCARAANGQATELQWCCCVCNGGGFMCGACAEGYALWHGDCVGTLCATRDAGSSHYDLMW